MPSSTRKIPGPTLCATAALGTLLFATANARADEAVPVRVIEAAAAEAAETLRLTGTVTARQRAHLSPRVSGLVKVVHVDAGDVVKRGDVLVELDRTLGELAVRRAEAALSEARTQLAEARRLQSEAKELVVDNFIPETEARARGANVELTDATATRLEVELREAVERLERHAVPAPFAGVIASKQTEAGEWVETGTPVVELVGTEGLRIDVQAPQERFSDIDADTRVAVRLDGHPREEWSGRVGAVVPVNDPGARTFLVRVLVDEAAEFLMPGMSAEVSFAIRGDGVAVTVPRDALVRAPDGSDRVWIVASDDGAARAEPRTVRIGRSLAETVEVVDGLEPGLPVVVRGNESLREGQAVQIVETAAEM